MYRPVSPDLTHSEESGQTMIQRLLLGNPTKPSKRPRFSPLAIGLLVEDLTSFSTSTFSGEKECSSHVNRNGLKPKKTLKHRTNGKHTNQSHQARNPISTGTAARS